MIGLDLPHRTADYTQYKTILANLD